MAVIRKWVVPAPPGAYDFNEVAVSFRDSNPSLLVVGIKGTPLSEYGAANNLSTNNHPSNGRPMIRVFHTGATEQDAVDALSAMMAAHDPVLTFARGYESWPHSGFINQSGGG